MNIRLGYWGSGPISNFHIPALREANLDPVVAYSRPESMRLREFSSRWGIKACNSQKEFLEECKSLDGIVIALETSVTPLALKSALNLGLPIMVEKPGGSNWMDLHRATQNLDRNLLFFAYNRREYNSVKYAKAFLQNKKEVSIQASFPDSRKGRWQFRINGCHILDTLAFMSGKLRHEGSWGSLDLEKSGFMSQFTSERGHRINLNCNWGAPDNVSIKISSEDECLVFQGFERVTHYKGMEIVEPTSEHPLRVYKPIEIHKVICSLSQGKPGFLEQARNYHRFIVEGKASQDWCDYEQAIHVLRVIDEIEERISA